MHPQLMLHDAAWARWFESLTTRHQVPPQPVAAAQGMQFQDGAVWDMWTSQEGFVVLVSNPAHTLHGVPQVGNEEGLDWVLAGIDTPVVGGIHKIWSYTHPLLGMPVHFYAAIKKLAAKYC